jgi:formylglycine-generating enzyme required for sulfatase activity/serine/threonine protein kinase
MYSILEGVSFVNRIFVSSKSDLAPGQTLLGRYRIIKRIGCGSTGVVYRAHDDKKGKDIAVKVIFPRLLTDKEIKERFLAEAGIASELYHPGVVKLSGVHSDDQYCFLTMELLEGRNLRQIMDARQKARKPFTRKEVIHIVTTLIDILHYAHVRTVHRNLKPENIWIGKNKKYRIMDFGVAPLLQTERPNGRSLTTGTDNYIAPEQLKDWYNVNSDADQYALGVLMCELLNGKISAKKIHSVRRRYKKVNRNISSVVAKMLAVNVTHRFRSIVLAKEGLLKTESRSRILLTNRKFNTLVATVVVSLTIVLLVNSQNRLIGFWDSIRPLSVQAKHLLFDETIKRVNDVNRLNRLLTKARRDLETSIKKGQNNIRSLHGDLAKARYESDKIEFQQQIDQALVDLARKQELKRFSERVIFSDGSLLQLESRVEESLSLLEQGQHRRATDLIKPIQDNLTKRLQQFSSAEKYPVVRERLAEAQLVWQQFNQLWKLQPPANIDQRLQTIASVRRQAEDGEFTGTLEQLEQFTRDFQSDHALDRQLVADRTSYRAQQVTTRNIEREWKYYLQRNDLKITAEQSSSIEQASSREQTQRLRQDFKGAEASNDRLAQILQEYFATTKATVIEAQRKLAVEKARKARESYEKSLVATQKSLAEAAAQKSLADKNDGQVLNRIPTDGKLNQLSNQEVDELLPDLLEKFVPGLELVEIPAGSFEMGSLNRGGERDEKPVRQVSVNGFKLMKHEVTFAQFDHYAEQTGKEKPDDTDWGRGDRPVINVDWSDVTAYSEWLSRSTGLTFRLPSEAEWEYAARGGTTTKYPWGNAPSRDKANYGHELCCRGLASGADEWVNTAPVGSFPANQYGISDMHGNVGEWVMDCWNDSYNQASNDERARLSGDCNRRVVRGGGWSSVPDNIRSANRTGTRANTRANYLGFRLVLEN